MTNVAANPTTLLLVDDEPNNVKIIQNDLEDHSFRVITANDGVEGWDALQEHGQDVKVILLDRMMPNMNGMEFMAKLKESDDYNHIPVIMQTAAAEKQQIIEGIEAGVYYYLTKPYQQDMLLAVLHSAIAEAESLMELKRELKQFKGKLALVTESKFEFQSVKEARHLAAFLANHYPESDRVTLGIWEMLLNAVEHGNAGISYKDKSKLLLEGTWEEEVNQRLVQPENALKKVHVHFKREPHHISLVIKDAGKGFDWSRYLQIDPARATHAHGRGIALASMMSFDGVEYNEVGNQVTCIVKT